MSGVISMSGKSMAVPPACSINALSFLAWSAGRVIAMPMPDKSLDVILDYRSPWDCRSAGLAWFDKLTMYGFN